MSKAKFENEYEINASQKILFPYFNTPGGLAQWFADDVKIDADKNFLFVWDDENIKARMTDNKREHYVKLEFLSNGNGSAGEEEDLPYTEFILEKNEFTQSTFLRVIEYSDFDDPEEMKDVWDGMIDQLKETVGG